jgi:hypothetical protein
MSQVPMRGQGDSAMDTTVREHMQRLDEKRQLLSAQVMEESDEEKRNQLESELRAVESALKFYREALETERRLFQQGFMH